jgi:iron complex outermembrane receptor protein
MKNRNLRVPLAALPLAILATISHAQTQMLPETVVTATRFTEEAASLPVGVSVITAEAIRASGATTVNEAIMRLLGVPGRLDLSGGSDYGLDLRGFGITASSNQVVMLDGIRLNEGDQSAARLSGISIDSVERIEVLRGNGTVLYGEGATGGVIVIKTKAGAGKARQSGASVYAGTGSDSLRDFRANATLAAGGFSVDFNGQKRDTDGHRDNFRSETDAAGLTAQWSNDFFRVGVGYDRDALDAGLPGPLDADQFQTNPKKTDEPNNVARIRNERSRVFAEAVLSDWTLAADGGWRDKTLRSFSPGSLYGYDVQARQLSLRARHAGRIGSANNALVIGHDRGSWSRNVAGFSPFGPYASLADQTSRGWYVKDDLTLASGTRLSAGLRTEKLNKSSADDFSASALGDSKTAWELGLSQPLNTTTTVWARAGNSFRFANVDEFSFTNPSVVIRPQTSKDLEAGIRWAQGAYKLETRVYRSNLTDEIGYDSKAPGPFGSGANINFDPTRRQGVEFDGDWAVSRQLNLSARLALRKSAFRSGPYGGNDVPLVPRQTLALRADWTPMAGHRITGGVNIVGSQNPDFANQCGMPSYTTADVRYAYQWKKAEFSLGVTNLFDRSYYTQAFSCSTGGVTGGIYPEAGRNFAAAVRVAF